MELKAVKIVESDSQEGSTYFLNVTKIIRFGHYADDDYFVTFENDKSEIQITDYVEYMKSHYSNLPIGRSSVINKESYDRICRFFEVANVE
jgi:hypothetical protein